MDDDEINLREYIDVILKRKKLIFLVWFIIGLGTLAVSLLMRPIYEAKAKILIRSSAPSSQYSGLAQLAGINLQKSANSPDDLSQIIKAKAVELMVKSKIYNDHKNYFYSQKEYKKIDIGNIKAKVEGSFIALSVENKNPFLAAEISNAYIESLSIYWNKLNYTEARKKREYIEKQLPIVEMNLKKIEQDYKNLTYLSDAKSLASANIELGRIKREIEIQNSVYIMLRNEYESAKLEESKEISPFSDIEKAEVPKSPSKPKIKLNLMIGIVIGLFIGVFVAFFKEFLEKEYSKS